MEFIETSVFSKSWSGLSTEAELRELQAVLVANPEAGDPVPGLRGIRKLRWAASGRGKRGGARVMYTLLPDDRRRGTYWCCLLLLAYPKNAQDDLTAEQARALARLAETIVHEIPRYSDRQRASARPSSPRSDS